MFASFIAPLAALFIALATQSSPDTQSSPELSPAQAEILTKVTHHADTLYAEGADAHEIHAAYQVVLNMAADYPREQVQDYLFHAHDAQMRLASGRVWEHREDEWRDKAIRSAQAVLDLLKPQLESGAVFYYLQREPSALVAAANTLAWDRWERSSGQEDYRRGLAFVEEGMPYAELPEHAFIYDTKIRLLLALHDKKHHDEAYALTRIVRQGAPDFHELDDIAQSDGYRQWLHLYRTQLNAEEKALLHKAARLHERIRQNPPRTKPAAMPPMQVIPFGQFKQQYGIDFYGAFDDDEPIWVIQGDIIIDGTLNWAFIEQTLSDNTSAQVNALYIDGNLTVNGDIIDDNYLRLAVKGDVKCDYLHSYNGHILIGGDLHAHYGVYGEYNDGSLEVAGKLHAPYVLSDDHQMPTFAEGEFIYIDYGRIGKAMESWYWQYFADSDKLLRPEVYAEGRFSAQRFFELVRAGKNPFIGTDGGMK